MYYVIRTSVSVRDEGGRGTAGGERAGRVGRRCYRRGRRRRAGGGEPAGAAPAAGGPTQRQRTGRGGRSGDRAQGEGGCLRYRVSMANSIGITIITLSYL
eukprot:1189439-Prorocentrum_minimum.AAC.1